MDLIFVVIVSILLLIPITKVNTRDSDIKENRTLAASPSLFKDNGLNNNYGKEFELWLNDRFRYREKLINIHDKVNAFFYNEFENSEAFVGKENWLFYKGEGSVELYQNKTIFTEAEMNKISENLKKRKQWLNSNGIAFFVMIPPDKNSVYGEYYKDGIMKIRPKNRVQLLEKYLQENDSEIKINYLLDVMNNHKKDGLLYFKTDTHWGEYGAYLGYLALMNDIQREFPDVYILSRDNMIMEKSKHPEGDLTLMLGINNHALYNDDYIVPVPKNGYHFSYIENNMQKGVKTHNSIRKLKVLVFRDSFATALVPYLSETFRDVEYIWSHSINDYQEKIIKESPDIVIHEIVSRGVIWFLQDTPAIGGGGK